MVETRRILTVTEPSRKALQKAIRAHINETPLWGGRGRRTTVSTATASQECFPAKITGGSGPSYTVDKYEKGIHEEFTGTGTIEVLNISVSETLPVDMWVLVHPCQFSITGGEEE